MLLASQHAAPFLCYMPLYTTLAECLAMSCSFITDYYASCIHGEGYSRNPKVSWLSELHTLHQGRMHSFWCSILSGKGKLFHSFCTYR